MILKVIANVTHETTGDIFMKKQSRQILAGIGLFTGLALAGCGATTEQVAYTAPTPGTRLSPDFTVREASWAPGCLAYFTDQGRMFQLTGGLVRHVQGSAPWVNLVLEQQPGGNACPDKHPQSGNPLLKLRRPMTYGLGTYTIHLPDRTCTLSSGTANCTTQSARY
jgi:hypothetical protein